MIVTWVGTTILIVVFIILVTGNPKYYVEGDFLIGKPLLVFPPFNPLIKIPISEIDSVYLTSTKWTFTRRGDHETKLWFCNVTTKAKKSILFQIYSDTSFSRLLNELHHKNPQIKLSDKLADHIVNNASLQLPRSRPIPTRTIIYTFILLLIWFLIVGIPEIVKQLTSY